MTPRTISRESSKADEISFFRTFCEALPEGTYLRSILKDMPEHVENMIRNDFGYSVQGELRAMTQAKLQAEAELRETKKRLEEVQKAVKDGEGQLSRLDEALKSIRSEARRIAGI